MFYISVPFVNSRCSNLSINTCFFAKASMYHPLSCASPGPISCSSGMMTATTFTSSLSMFTTLKTRIIWPGRIVCLFEFTRILQTPSFVPGTLKRLAPNQSDVVQISVKKKLGVKAGKTCTGTAIASYDGRGGNQVSQTFSRTCGFADYVATEAHIKPHACCSRLVSWHQIRNFRCIHWSPCSVPAYGITGKNKNYAKWYVSEFIDDKIAW